MFNLQSPTYIIRNSNDDDEFGGNDDNDDVRDIGDDDGKGDDEDGGGDDVDGGDDDVDDSSSLAGTHNVPYPCCISFFHSPSYSRPVVTHT